MNKYEYLIRRIWDPVYNEYAMLSQKGKNFQFQGKPYPYFLARYNVTALNERSVEIPIICDVIRKNQGKEILEIGNVLSHYYSVNHTIVDKFERGRDVINEDICSYSPGRQFDLIVSISTIEHIGYGYESENHPEDVFRAIATIKNLLKPGGKAYITIPVNYNPFLDMNIKSGVIHFDTLFCMKRISKKNDWEECTYEEVWDCPYGFPYATGLLIGIWEK